jgi:outer membrane protein assembly factor BamD (BamD/ComL family)
MKDLASVQQVLKQYAKDGSAEFCFAQVLFHCQKQNWKAAARVLKQAQKSNQHVVPFFLGRKLLPRALPAYMTMGGEDEAVQIVANYLRLWVETPGAMEWLKQACS